MRSFRIDQDLFFISQDFYDDHQVQLRHSLVVPMKEFGQHSSYETVHSASNHSLWQITCDYALVAPGGWFEQQPVAFQQALSAETIKNGSTFVDGGRPLTIQYWQALGETGRDRLVSMHDDAPCAFDMDSLEGYAELKALHGVFPKQHGANCLGSTLYAISKNPFILHEWVHQQTFLLFLQRSGYQQVEGKNFQADDVLCFFGEGILQHACYAISPTHCFNKSGQTFWEPWLIARFESIQEDCEGLEYRVFRRVAE